MGGSINVAIRMRNGDAFCWERWTNSMPHWFKNPKMFAGDEEHVRGYINLTRNVDYIISPHGVGRPKPLVNSEYGLIVWDYVTNTILDNNHYSDPTTLDAMYATNYFDDREDFENCARAGILRLVTWEKAKDDPEVSITKTDWLKYEEAKRVGIAAHLLSEYRVDGDDFVTRSRFEINTAPMVYYRYDQTAAETKAMRAKLREMGFPMTRKEGLNAKAIKIPRRKVSAQEMRARELYSLWKNQPETNDPEAVNPKDYDGVPFEAASDAIRIQLMRKAEEMTDEQMRKMRLYDSI